METIPVDLKKALNARAKAVWDDLTPVSRRDFIRWITSAKQAETRKKRIRVAVSKLLSGKRRPCCYEVVPMNLYKALGELPKSKAAWKALTADEKRDFVDWLDEEDDKEKKMVRIAKICVMLAAGKKHP